MHNTICTYGSTLQKRMHIICQFISKKMEWKTIVVWCRSAKKWYTTNIHAALLTFHKHGKPNIPNENHVLIFG